MILPLHHSNHIDGVKVKQKEVTLMNGCYVDCESG